MIGDTLKRTRKIYGYTATELSRLLEISPSYLSDLEILERYSKTYGIKLSSLILLSETLEEAEKSGKGNSFIRSMMLQLINNMSKGLGDS